VSEDATTRTTTGRGEFFAVDRRAWVVACRQGLNPAVAYLVLACFTGRDQRTTKAGVHAVERHAGIARSRARTAIEVLERAGLVTKPEGKGTTRRIVPAHEATLRAGSLAPEGARLPRPAAHHDGPCRSPLVGPLETRRVAGAGRTRRATG
jgi:hypothetical protein